jgi:multidrug resistance efflux pump
MNQVNKQTPMDPVRRWTFIVLAICIVLLAWYLRADRVTPYSSQARVNALVVPIASLVSGNLTDVFVANNQLVKLGQALFQVDIQNYQLAVQTARANLTLARQSVGAAQANVDAAEASVSAAKASVTRSRQDAIRMRNIRKEDPGAISVRRLQSAEATLAMDLSNLSSAQANRTKAIESLGAEGENNASILQARAALDQAELNLERATVRAPEDGVVTGVRLDKGNYAAAGSPLLTFIAMHNVWVQADFTENNLGSLNAGDEVEIVFDVLPGQVVHGSVREVSYGIAVDSAPLGSLPTIENDPDWLRQSQRFTILIDFELNREQGSNLLKVGSQASVVVYSGDHWLSNALAGMLIRLVSILTYAY